MKGTVCAVIILMGYLLSCESVPSLAGGMAPASYYETPETLTREVSLRGAQAVVSELYSDSHAWNFVLQNIERGQESWLKAAVTLHRGADAGASEMLDLSVGNALENDPENVFRITLKEFTLESICSSPDIDDTRYDSYELAMKAIRKRQERVKTISDLSLVATRDQCINLLEKAKADVAKFYDVN